MLAEIFLPALNSELLNPIFAAVLYIPVTIGKLIKKG
jgi:hypothetical protein